jgi:hypothetical protein
MKSEAALIGGLIVWRDHFDRGGAAAGASPAELIAIRAAHRPDCTVPTARQSANLKAFESKCLNYICPT